MNLVLPVFVVDQSGEVKKLGTLIRNKINNFFNSNCAKDVSLAVH